MFRIRRIFDDNNSSDKTAIEAVQKILKEQFPLISDEEINKLPAQLKDPLKYKFRTTLFVADNLSGKINGFAILLYFSDLNFCYLDFISTSKLTTGRGVGSALYSAVRDESIAIGAKGIFMECLPDDPKLCIDPEILKQNISRLRFYENFGARPIINTKYETPLKEGDDNPPYLVFDDCGRSVIVRSAEAKIAVKNILERKYPEVCPADYINMVVNSFNDDPILLRDYKYITNSRNHVTSKISRPSELRIQLIVHDKHSIHHIKERGYVESPVRIKSILRAIDSSNNFNKVAIKHFPEKCIEDVHDKQLINYFKNVCKVLPEGKSIYPYVFPIRNRARPPLELPMRAGYFCIDTFTPINAKAYEAAKRSVDCALTGAEIISTTMASLAYALVRPPGHHAEINSFGGFCYFNSGAIAANYLSSLGKVAMLDIDYHHGNGQQHIFYKRNDVLTISIHGHPKFAYPFFTGFENETGEESGLNFNINYPLPEKITAEKYHQTLSTAVNKIKSFNPKFLIVPFGLDTAKGDPTGTWELTAKDFFISGQIIAELKKPTLFVQEGGYNNRNIGTNAKNFFEGFISRYYS